MSPLLDRLGLDRVVPTAHSRHIADRIAHARLHLLPGEGHFSAAVGWIDTILRRLVEPTA